MKIMNLVGTIARRLGFDLTKVRSATGKVVGARLVRVGFDQSPISTFGVDGQILSFFVADPADLVQQCHAKSHLYEIEELEIIKKHFRGGVFVDVGANVGNHLVYALKILGASNAIAFEPNPSANAILRVNIALNDLANKTTVHAIGLSSSKGCASVEFQQVHNLGSARLATGTGSLVVERGDAILNEPINFIKIDTEGMELEVLAGLHQTITRCRPVLFVEVEDIHLSGFEALLTEHQYEIIEHFRRYPGLANYVATPMSNA